MVRLNWTVAEGRRSAQLREPDAKEEALLEALRHAEAAAAVLVSSGDDAPSEEAFLLRRTHAEIAQANLALGVARKKRYFSTSKTQQDPSERLVAEPLEAALRAFDALHGSHSSQAAAAKYQLGSFLAERFAAGVSTAGDRAFALLHHAKRDFLGLGLRAHAVLCAVALSDLLDARRERAERAKQSADAAADESPLSHALVALAELVEARHALARADPEAAADAVRQIKARLPARAKALLHHALLQKSNPLIAARCKPAYKAALTVPDLADALDAIAVALEPFVVRHHDDGSNDNSGGEGGGGGTQ